MSRLINNSQKLSDEEWFSLVASLLNSWMLFEKEFVHPESQTLLELLQSKKLLQLDKGIRTK